MNEDRRTSRAVPTIPRWRASTAFAIIELDLQQPRQFDNTTAFVKSPTKTGALSGTTEDQCPAFWSKAEIAAKLLRRWVRRGGSGRISPSCRSCCDAQSLTGVDPATALRIEFANRVNYVVRVRPR